MGNSKPQLFKHIIMKKVFLILAIAVAATACKKESIECPKKPSIGADSIKKLFDSKKRM